MSERYDAKLMVIRRGFRDAFLMAKKRTAVNLDRGMILKTCQREREIWKEKWEEDD